MSLQLNLMYHVELCLLQSGEFSLNAYIFPRVSLVSLSSHPAARTVRPTTMIFGMEIGIGLKLLRPLIPNTTLLQLTDHLTY